MKFTTIVCTECNEPREVAGTVTLPYVCVGCQEDAEEAAEFNQVTAPASSFLGTNEVPAVLQAGPVETHYEGDPGDEHEHVHNHDGDACEGATVEATNELIANLEEEIKAYKETLAVADAAVGQAGEVLTRAMDRIIDLKADNQEMSKSLAASNKSLDVLISRVLFFKSEARFYHRQYRKKRDEANFYRTQGFFGRLFHVRYRA